MEYSRKRSLGNVSAFLALVCLVPVAMSLAQHPLSVLGVVFVEPAHLPWAILVRLPVVLFVVLAARRMRRPHRIRLEPDRVVISGRFGISPRTIERDWLGVVDLADELVITGADHSDEWRREVVPTSSFHSWDELCVGLRDLASSPASPAVARDVQPAIAR